MTTIDFFMLHTEHVIVRCSSVVLLQCIQVGLTSLFGAVAFVDGVTGPGFGPMPPTNNNDDSSRPTWRHSTAVSGAA